MTNTIERFIAAEKSDKYEAAFPDGRFGDEAFCIWLKSGLSLK
jgi:hypothetical protein